MDSVRSVRSVRSRASSPATGGALVVGGAVLWGTTGTAHSLGPESATPLAVGATRLVAGGALLVLWALVSRARRGGWRRRSAAAQVGAAGAEPSSAAQVGAAGAELSSASGVRSTAAAIAGVVGVAAYQVAFFAAVDAAGVALGTAVAIGSAPVMTGLIQWAIGGGRPTGRWWLATAVAAMGVAILSGPSSLAPDGVALALLAGTSYAVYAVASKRLLDSGLDSGTAMAVVFGGGGLLLVPALAFVDLGWLTGLDGVAMVAWLAVATILVAYLLFGAGLRHIPASTAATLSLAEPLTAAVLGIAVLGERPTPAGMVGAAIILLGLLILLGRRTPAVPAPG